MKVKEKWKWKENKPRSAFNEKVKGKWKEINLDLPFQCRAAKSCDVLQIANVTKLENTQKSNASNPNFTLAAEFSSGGIAACHYKSMQKILQKYCKKYQFQWKRCKHEKT